MSARDVAKSVWGNHLPGWVLYVAKAVDVEGISVVADRIGLSERDIECGLLRRDPETVERLRAFVALWRNRS